MPRKRSIELRKARTAAARALFRLDLAGRAKGGELQAVADATRALVDLTMTETDRVELRGWVAAHVADGGKAPADHWCEGRATP